MIIIRGQPPPTRTQQFFHRLLPGIWSQWGQAAEFALNQIDAEGFGETTITSWFRTLSDNARVGGDPDSQHLVGLALDVVPGKGISRLAINEAAQIFEAAGFIAVPEERHVHVQTFPAGVLRQVGVLDALSV